MKAEPDLKGVEEGGGPKGQTSHLHIEGSDFWLTTRSARPLISSQLTWKRRNRTF